LLGLPGFDNARILEALEGEGFILLKSSIGSAVLVRSVAGKDRRRNEFEHLAGHLGAGGTGYGTTETRRSSGGMACSDDRRDGLNRRTIFSPRSAPWPVLGNFAGPRNWAGGTRREPAAHGGTTRPHLAGTSGPATLKYSGGRQRSAEHHGLEDGHPISSGETTTTPLGWGGGDRGPPNEIKARPTGQGWARPNTTRT